MSSRLVGKPSPTRLAELISLSGTRSDKRLLVGPGPGLDSAIVDMGDGRVMAVAEDPIFPAVNLPLDMMGEFTVHIGASDVAVTGVKPEFMTYTLLLPGACPESDAKCIIESITRNAESLGITIVGGHTGWYEVVNVPIVGGVCVWGFANDGNWISPGGAKKGDLLLMTKGPSIEASALLGVLYKNKLTGKLSSDILDSVCSRTNQISVVKDALTAFKTGKVHAMHDATEGGVLGGLWEMAASSGLGVKADLDSVPVPDDIAAFSNALQFDPWAAISEGTLLAAVDPAGCGEVMKALDEVGICSYVLGEFTESGGVMVKRNGNMEDIDEPSMDPFWNLFFAGVSS